ncbi:MAG TPA: glycosyltransferase family 4 protein [Nitrosospira sp.]|nr:glycosyltransferase family 4 protein [Nitrosospira sp.]
MRVCFISHSAGRYGAELALLELLEGLVRCGIDCKVLVPEKGPLLVELDRLQIEWRLVEFPLWRPHRRKIRSRIFRTIKALSYAFSMARAILEWKCDIVYTNTVMIVAGAFAAFLARKPHVWHLHEFGYVDPKEQFDLGRGIVTWLIDYLSAAVIANSNTLKQEYAKYVDTQKFHVIYQAVTLKKFTDSSPLSIAGITAFKCIIIGSLQKAKAQDEAILALAEARRQGVPATLLLIGEGDQSFRLMLKELAERCGVAQQVIFYGYARNLMPLINSADAVLICSRSESFGRVTVEAMLAGKAVIGAAGGGTLELIRDGSTGLLYSPGNYLELAAKIRYLYENVEQKLGLGATAYAWAKDRFCQKKYAREVIKLLEEVVEGKKNRYDECR